MVEELDVDAVITICPFCENNIRASLEAEGLDLEVMNILTFWRNHITPGIVFKKKL
jgi:fumarate reductase (CoM/CoB) subunit B